MNIELKKAILEEKLSRLNTEMPLNCMIQHFKNHNDIFGNSDFDLHLWRSVNQALSFVIAELGPRSIQLESWNWKLGDVLDEFDIMIVNFICNTYDLVNKKNGRYAKAIYVPLSEIQEESRL